jgi:hypothetical protein
MILPLRRVHRVAWLAVAVLVTLVVGLALAGRAPEAPPQALPGASERVSP